jgi:excisionase family DNA binding protein
MISIDASLTPKDLAARWAVPRSWVYRMAQVGALPSFKIGRYVRFRPREIDAWMESRRRLQGSTSESTSSC